MSKFMKKNMNSAAAIEAGTFLGILPDVNYSRALNGRSVKDEIANDMRHVGRDMVKAYVKEKFGSRFPPSSDSWAKSSDAKLSPQSKGRSLAQATVSNNGISANERAGKPTGAYRSSRKEDSTDFGRYADLYLSTKR